jgi:hypothetical protein
VGVPSLQGTDTADDRSVPELSNRDKALLQRALAEHAPGMLDYRDLSQAHRVVADGLRFDDSVIQSKSPIKNAHFNK